MAKSIKKHSLEDLNESAEDGTTIKCRENCVKPDGSKTESEIKNKDENPKSINDNNEQVNRINEGENIQVEERQNMQIMESEDKDEVKCGDEVLMSPLVELPCQDSRNEEQPVVNKTINIEGSISHISDVAGDTKMNSTNIDERNIAPDSKTYDSVSVYSNQDFSQISDYSDEENLSSQIVRECVGDSRSNSDFYIKKANCDVKQQKIVDSVDVEKSTEALRKQNEVINSKLSTPPSKRRFDFTNTNSRINGDSDEDTRKRGIRVLQPPGGFSSGLW